ncbi:unnamed protein product [Rhizoctonia solani]|uniref:Uncharacterized protein n=1 Tax=Rhizoctonia solani TaxID=456999 RepID=A0A8H3DYA0_9AGAM|nr:unnamed protein product [Rhizoctonia solani]
MPEGSILSAFLPQAIPEIFAVTLFNGSSLLVAALIQIKSGNISILDNLVLVLLSSVPLCITIVQSIVVWQYQVKLERDPEVIIKRRYCLTRFACLVLGVAYFVLWCVWVATAAATPARFREDPADTGCSPTETLVVVIWGQRSSNKNKLRKNIIIVLLCVLAVLVAIANLIDFRHIYRISRPFLPKKHDSSANGGDKQNGDDDKGDRGQHVQPKPVGFTGIAKIVFNDSKLWNLLPLFMISYQVVFISTIEETIAANKVTSEGNAWSYGQVTALAAAILQTITSFCQLIIEWSERRAARKKRGDTESRQLQEKEKDLDLGADQGLHGITTGSEPALATLSYRSAKTPIRP